MYSDLSKGKLSAPRSCNGCSKAGVGRSGCYGSHGWWCWHVGNDSTRCLMSELILGQYTWCLTLFWHLLIPTCPSCIAWRIFSLSDAGMMRASPQRMRPSSTVRMFLWPWYGCRTHGTSLILSGPPVMIISTREWRSRSSWMRVWNSVLLLGMMCTWLMVLGWYLMVSS